MPVNWKQEMSVGIGDIDVQHRKIIGKMNEIAESIEKKGDPEKLKETVKFLEVYLENHFRTEEMFMLHYVYPGLKEHQEKHADFVKRLEHLADNIRKGEVDAAELYNESFAVYNWFTIHIETVDKKMGEFLRSKMR
jgi:hemerythrin